MTRMISMTATVAMLLIATALAFPTGFAEAQRPDSCLGGTLTPPNPDGSDLVVKVDCTVGAGTYKFGNVHIIAGGTLRFTDATIDFWAKNILVENGGGLVAGVDKDDKIAPIGTNGGVVTIHLYGQDQTGRDPKKPGKGITCLSDPERCGAPDLIWSSNMSGMDPVTPASARRVQDLCSGKTGNDLTSCQAIINAYGGPKDDYFYAYHPLFLDDADHQAYFGYKTLGIGYGATLKLFGKKGSCVGAGCETDPLPYSGKTGQSWVRLAATVGPDDAGDKTTLTVDPAVDWKQGDQIVVTTTDYLPGHSEQLTVAEDTNNGTTVKLTGKVQHIHNGARYPLSSVPDGILSPTLKSQGAETRAAVALLSRNIKIVSGGDNADDLPKETDPPCTSKPVSTSCYFGGHVVIRQGFKTVQIQGVEFYQLGQGGKLGHYPIHFHHARRTPPGTFVNDSSIWDSMTRWIVLHGTQDVTLARNVGYKSIGHGFYLEDGTEINNRLLANAGIFARAAVENKQNPRQVPGILAAPNLDTVIDDLLPYKSDYDHPTVFWMMNGWNDFQYNLAAGAGTCGVCYWLVPGANSTISRVVNNSGAVVAPSDPNGKGPKWDSYASMQWNLDRAASTPLKSFIGNSCSSAMTSFQTIGKTEACKGISGPTDTDFLKPVNNPLAANSNDLTYYPTVDTGGGRFATQCGGPTNESLADCSVTPGRCSDGNPSGCMVTVLDRYTTSFNWAPFNFAAIWLRPQWYLLTDSVITDAQMAGLTMVTGGGYTTSDVIPGHWALTRRTAFIGHTQANNPYASDGGPFNPQTTLRCALLPENAGGIRPTDRCVVADEGVTIQTSNFGMYQRLFSVYDGPAFQESNAYLNIKKRVIDDCVPKEFFAGNCKVNDPDPECAFNCRDVAGGKQCERLNDGRCVDPQPPFKENSVWVAGRVQGLPMSDDKKCYMPNAAIGWKQPNGFYYPPAFHSDKLFFQDVDVRHFVLTPLFQEGTLTPDIGAISKQYCKWDRSLFTGFAGNDRQTVLNDDDGSLTGYKNTTVINLDDFFLEPIDAIQCRSDNTSRTSPYAWVTTVVYPKCVLDGSCAKAPNPGPPVGDGFPNTNFGDWNRACTSEQCYGVPLYRQDAMPLSDNGIARSIRMMGQETSQRSSLTVNHGTYYLDTTVGKTRQCGGPDKLADCSNLGSKTANQINVFKAGETYYLFLIFAKEDTEQIYQFYVGPGANDDPLKDISIQTMQAEIGKNPIVYSNFQILPSGKATWVGDRSKGVVQVVLTVKDVLPNFATKLKDAKKKKCQPTTYCTWNDTANNGAGACEDKNPEDPQKKDAVCRWAIADLDCPDGGCIGITFTLPGVFKTDPSPDPRPAPACVVKTTDTKNPKFGFNVSLDDRKVSDGTCPVAAETLKPDFCAGP